MVFSGPPRDEPSGGWRARDDFHARDANRGDYEPRRSHDSHDRRRYDARRRSRSRSRSPRRHALSSHAPPPTDGPTRQWGSQPSATLIVRGLTPNVSDPMLLRALEAFRPTSVRVMFHKTTGEHRGFAFANFDSVQTATAVMDAFSSQPLVIDNQPAILAYAETNRPSPHFQRQHHGDGGPPAFGGGPPRLDWICDQCGSSNFGRRTECFKCHMPKSQFAMEVPPRGAPHPRSNFGPPGHNGGEYRGHGDRMDRGPPEHRYGHGDEPARREHRDFEDDEPPSHVLAIRMIPLDVDEGELQVVFAQFEGVRDIRLIRDRATNQSRGFAFVEFEDLEFAQRVRNKSDGLIIRGDVVRVGYAREGLHPKPPPSRALEVPVPVNPIAAAALEQAQWAMANNYGAMHQPAAVEEPALAPSAGLDDLDALLNNAAAAARPHIEEPKKPWPQPFETGGGMYVYASDCGHYYDTDSMFYYDPHSKVYFSSFTGLYYRCPNGAQGAGATFELFSPPPPVDDAKFTPDQPTSTSTAAPPIKPVTLSLAKKDKKKPLISFNLKPSSTTNAGKTAGVFTSEKIPVSAGPNTNLPFGSGVSMAAAASASIRKKSALDIAKWSQRQLEESKPPVEPITAKQTSAPLASGPVSTTPVPATATVDIPLEAPICLLCRRKFGSMEQLRKHETQSKLHAENLAKAKQDKAIVAAQVRERDEEDREEQQSRKRQRPGGEASSTVPVEAQQPPPASATESAAAATLEAGIGAKMLKMMGWKKGEGLGKHGTGITAPVEAVGNAGTETTGLGAKTAPAINLSDVASYKERLQKMARARYDATDIHDTKNL